MTSIDTRKGWMGLLAKAPAEVLDSLWIKLGTEPAFTWLRAPEIGGVMVRARMGGTGAAFNLGEMTITRCALRLQGGVAVGHAWIQGRNKEKARQAALIDAFMQTGRAAEVREVVLRPLARQMDDSRAARTAKAAATRVDFFTMVRGDN